MDFKDLLKLMVKYEASDLYLTTGAPASMRIEGTIKPILDKPMLPNEVKEIASKVMSPEQNNEFRLRPEMNLAISEPGIGRFRVNIFRQRNQIGMVVRNIKTIIPSPTDLGLPPIMSKLVMQKRGLILIVGATGSGKSTSLAALIDYRNGNSAGHIITIEDPIEYIYQHKKSIINQREVGLDTLSYGDALKNALRQAPDVILIGEVRDRETMEHAIAFAETGHLCISTLHANNANQALDRIINFFSDDRRNQLLLDLSLNMRGIVSQRLVLTVEGKRTAAVEVLLGTPLINDLIRRGDLHTIKEIMEKSENLGMQTFDSALFKLYKAGRLTLEETLRNADSHNNLRLRINLSENKSAETDSRYTIASDETMPNTAPAANNGSGLSLKMQED